MFKVIATFHVLRASSPVAATWQPMLDHREVKEGSAREAGTVERLELRSFIDAPSVENGDTGISQVLGNMGT